MTWFAGSIILGIAASELASASGCSCSSEDAWVVSRGLLVRSSSEVKEKDSFSETVAPEIELNWKKVYLRQFTDFQALQDVKK